MPPAYYRADDHYDSMSQFDYLPSPPQSVITAAAAAGCDWDEDADVLRYAHKPNHDKSPTIFFYPTRTLRYDLILQRRLSLNFIQIAAYNSSLVGVT